MPRKTHARMMGVEDHLTFRISREVIVGYPAEILIMQLEGGASKYCAKYTRRDGRNQVVR